MTESVLRRAFCEVDLGAIRRNAERLVGLIAPARLLAVVKARGYGHGASQVAEAALAGGATWLGVATVEEALDIQRRLGPDAARILVLSEPQTAEAADAVVRRGLTPIVYSAPGIEMLAKAAVEAGAVAPIRVHLKIDTGMHRIGCDPSVVGVLADLISTRGELELEGLCTHFALADDETDPYTRDQIDRFEAARAELGARGIRPPVVHAANSAATFGFPEARYDLVRVGIALYGVPPAPGFPTPIELEPAMTLRARVTHVRRLDAGERISYGLRHELARATNVAVVPVGYADGVPRNLGLRGGEVLVGGRRCPIVGAVTMDMLMVDVGDEAVSVGDDVVLIGRQGDDEITATEWAERLDTIAYEIVTGIGPRVSRRYR